MSSHHVPPVDVVLGRVIQTSAGEQARRRIREHGQDRREGSSFLAFVCEGRCLGLQSNNNTLRFLTSHRAAWSGALSSPCSSEALGYTSHLRRGIPCMVISCTGYTKESATHTPLSDGRWKTLGRCADSGPCRLPRPLLKSFVGSCPECGS